MSGKNTKKISTGWEESQTKQISPERPVPNFENSYEDFDSYEELKNYIMQLQQERRFDFEQGENNPYITSFEPGTFEKVLMRDGKFMLFPANWDYQFLYRGQTAEYGKCIPSLYRGLMTPERHFMEELRIAEFELLAKAHPVVKHVFEKNNYCIDYKGLAQHYGFRTNVLDLTLDLDIALFFAMCDYDILTDSYYPKLQDIKYTGIVYFYNVRFDRSHSMDEFFDLFTRKLKVIGLQPFKRPGVQKGFSIELKKDEGLKAVVCRFRYTKKDSVEYFEKFGKGNSLWIKDIVADKAKLIRKADIHSIQAVELASRKEEFNKMPLDFYLDLLKYKHIRVLPDTLYLPWWWTKEEAHSIARAWDEKEEEEFYSNLRSRKSNYDGVDYDYMRIEHLLVPMMLRSIYSGVGG